MKTLKTSYKKAFSLFSAVLIGFVLPAHFAHASIMISVQAGLMGAIAIVVNVIAYLVGWFMSLFITLFDIALDYTVVNFATEIGSTPAIEFGWKLSMSIANVIFIFALIYIAISTIVGINLKRQLTTILAVALLVNFSLPITKIVIDTSNVLAVSLHNKSLNIINPRPPLPPADKERTIGEYLRDQLALEKIEKEFNLKSFNLRQLERLEATKTNPVWWKYWEDEAWDFSKACNTRPKIMDGWGVTDYADLPENPDFPIKDPITHIPFDPDKKYPNCFYFPEAEASDGKKGYFSFYDMSKASDIARVKLQDQLRDELKIETAKYNITLAFLRLIFMSVTTLVFINMTAILLMRAIMLIMLMVVSALAVASLAVGGTLKGKIFTPWMDSLFNFSFAAPVFLFFLYVVIGVIHALSPTPPPYTPVGDVDIIDAPAGSLFDFVIIIGLLWFAYKATKKMTGVSVAGYAQKVAMAGAGLATGGVVTGVAMAGREVSRGAASAARRVDAAGWKKQGGIKGRISNKLDSKAQDWGKSSFDVRNTKLGAYATSKVGGSMARIGKKDKGATQLALDGQKEKKDAKKAFGEYQTGKLKEKTKKDLEKTATKKGSPAPNNKDIADELAKIAKGAGSKTAESAAKQTRIDAQKELKETKQAKKYGAEQESFDRTNSAQEALNKVDTIIKAKKTPTPQDKADVAAELSKLSHFEMANMGESYLKMSEFQANVTEKTMKMIGKKILDGKVNLSPTESRAFGRGAKSQKNNPNNGPANKGWIHNSPDPEAQVFR